MNHAQKSKARKKAKAKAAEERRWAEEMAALQAEHEAERAKLAAFTREEIFPELSLAEWKRIDRKGRL
jgi:hypothetical protein